MAVIRFDEMLYDRARPRSPINPPGGADVSLNNDTRLRREIEKLTPAMQGHTRGIVSRLEYLPLPPPLVFVLRRIVTSLEVFALGTERSL